MEFSKKDRRNDTSSDTTADLHNHIIGSQYNHEDTIAGLPLYLKRLSNSGLQPNPKGIPSHEKPNKESNDGTDSIMCMPATGLLQLKLANHADANTTPLVQCDVEEEGETIQEKNLSTELPPLEHASESEIQFSKEGLPSGNNQNVVDINNSAGAPLPAKVRGNAEAAFQTDFNKVRIHNEPSAWKAARQFKAKAFTIGNDIYFSQGRYQLDTPRGLELMGHEFAHVVQQRSGLSQARVKQSNNTYEQEANAAGCAFSSGASIPAMSASSGSCKGPQYSADTSEQESLDEEDAGQIRQLPVLGRANSYEEAYSLLDELSLKTGGEQYDMIALNDLFGYDNKVREDSEVAPPTAQASPETQVIQMAVDPDYHPTNCRIPGLGAAKRGIVIHEQIQEYARSFGYRAPYKFRRGTEADLVREFSGRIRLIPEIGEIKPASWMGSKHELAKAQLRGYLTQYRFERRRKARPMRFFSFPPQILRGNSSRVLKVYPPQEGIYYYRCISKPRWKPPPAPVTERWRRRIRRGRPIERRYRDPMAPPLPVYVPAPSSVRLRRYRLRIRAPMAPPVCDKWCRAARDSVRNNTVGIMVILGLMLVIIVLSPVK